MHFIVYTVKGVPSREKKKHIPQVFYVMYGMSLKATRFQRTAYFSPSTHPQLLHKMETRLLTVVEHFYGKVEYIQLIFLTFSERVTQWQESLSYPHSRTPDLVPAYTKRCAKQFKIPRMWKCISLDIVVTVISFQGRASHLKLLSVFIDNNSQCHDIFALS